MKEALINIINDNFILPVGKTKVDEHTNLFKTGLIDSFALLDLLLIIEDEFNVSLEISEIIGDGIETINEFVTFINKHQSG